MEVKTSQPAVVLTAQQKFGQKLINIEYYKKVVRGLGVSILQ